MGEFGQRTNLAQTTVVTQLEQYCDITTSDRQDINNERFINDGSVQIDWVYNDDFIQASSRTNVVIVAHKTAQARFKLYSYLRFLGDGVLYVIYIQSYSSHILVNGNTNLETI